MSHYPHMTLVTPPASEPLTLAEVKGFLRIDSNDEDTLLTELMIAVRKAAESFINAALLTQTWELEFNSYVPLQAMLPFGPVQSINFVKLLDKQGNETTFSSAAYRLSAGNQKLIFDITPMSPIIKIQYVTGYGDSASDVQSDIKQGMLHHITEIFEGRSGGHALPPQAMNLYSAYRTVRL